MEKLQAAIEKARANRGSAPATRARTSNAQRQSTDEDIWDALPRMKWSEAELKRKRVFSSGDSREAAGYDLLRTKILQLCRENEWKRVVVTSPTKSCGKTTTCANIAASLSRQSDRRTMLMDLDMRRPGLANMMSQTGEHSFSSVLEGKVPYEDQARLFSSNVAVSMNYHVAPNPSKLIMQDSTARILAGIEQTFQPDLMIFDCPPMLATDDTLAFLKNVDCALIVAAAEKTTIDEVDTCEKEISEQTNVLGTVLNKCAFTSEGQGYEYNY